VTVPPDVPRRYDGIFFDFDGVLADTEPVHWQCWSTILSRYGIDLSWEHYERECIGVSDRDMLDALRRLAERPVDLETLLAEYPNKKRLFRAWTEAASPVRERR
jgi:beta-phosphoglucomutase